MNATRESSSTPTTSLAFYSSVVVALEACDCPHSTPDRPQFPLQLLPVILLSLPDFRLQFPLNCSHLPPALNALFLSLRMVKTWLKRKYIFYKLVIINWNVFMLSYKNRAYSKVCMFQSQVGCYGDFPHLPKSFTHFGTNFKGKGKRVSYLEQVVF